MDAQLRSFLTASAIAAALAVNQLFADTPAVASAKVPIYFSAEKVAGADPHLARL